MTPSVPFVDLKAARVELGGELDAALERVLDSGWYLLGGELEEFERSFAAYCGVEHCVGVGSGLSALELSLKAAGIGPGDEVIVPAYTWIATWTAVTLCGATPVGVEVLAETYNIDPEAAAAAVTERTAAIVPVHLRGEPAAIEPLRRLAAERGLFLLEDAAQAHGAREGGVPAGALGDAAAFSFYPGKNLGAFGDGGAVTTSDAELAARVRLLGNYGSPAKYVHDEIGDNSRLDPLQAAMLGVKLGALERWTARREAIAATYLHELRGVTLPGVRDDVRHVWHLLCVRHESRDALAAHLARAGVQTLVHYPTPPHLTGAFAGLGLPAGSFPVAEHAAATLLSLPIGPHLGDGDVARVCEAVGAFVPAPVEALA